MKLTRNLAGLAAAAAAIVSTPALADSITLDAGDVGTSYSLNYNGFADGSTINGLSGSATFTLTAASANSYTFNYSVKNTSTSPVTGSRISSFAFDTNPDIKSASSTGAFSFTTVSSTYPNGIGGVDVCFKSAFSKSCSNSGGVSAGQTGTGTFTLNFASPVSSLTLSDFYVRYQSITGVKNVTSASGAGTLAGGSTSSGGTPVPEPGMVGLFGAGLVGLALLRRRRPSLRAVRAA